MAVHSFLAAVLRATGRLARSRSGVSALLFAAVYLAHWYMRHVARVRLYTAPHSVAARAVARCPSLGPDAHFYPSLCASSGYAQTFIDYLWPSISSVRYLREPLVLEDGGVVNIDWAEHTLPHRAPARGVVAVLPGLTGTSGSTYIRRAVHTFARAGFIVAVLNYRGLCNTRLLSARSYNAGCTEDIRKALSTMQKHFPSLPLFAIGYSMGSNLLCKLLGEIGMEGCENISIAGACSVSNPFNLGKAVATWNSSAVMQLINMTLAGQLRKLILQHTYAFEGQQSGVDFKGIERANSVMEIDEAFTRRLGGWNSVKDYYDESSCERFLPHVRSPLLIVSSLDDPLCPPEVIPDGEELTRSNPNIAMAITKNGGHVTFLKAGLNPFARWESFADRAAAEYFLACRDNGTT